MVLAPGGPPYGVVPLAQELELENYGGYILSFKGGMIPDCCTRKVIFKQELRVEANRRIVEAAARRLKTPLDKWYLNMEHYGNMSAATIPIAIDEMDQKGLLKRGQKLLLLGFGAGLTWGGTLLEW